MTAEDQNKNVSTISPRHFTQSFPHLTMVYAAAVALIQVVLKSALRLAIEGKTAEESLAKNTVRRDKRRVETLKQVCRAIAAAGENL